MTTKAERAEALAAEEADSKANWLDNLVGEGIAEEQLEEEKAAEPITSELLMKYAAELVDVENEKRQKEAELKQIGDRRSQLRTQLIPDAMNSLGMVDAKGKGSFTFAGNRFQLENKLHASVSAAGKQAFFEFLRQNGDDEIIKETVHAQTLSAYVRECRSEGLNDPPGVSVHEEVTAKMVRVRS